MKKIIVLLLAGVLCLTAAACRQKIEPEEIPQEIHTEAAVPEKESEELQQESPIPSEDAEAPEETPQQSVDLAGLWHLDCEKNDVAALEDCFPGYAEWGASMELQSDGQMNWYIGAEGWHGTYEVDAETLHAELDSDLEAVSLPWDFRIFIENEAAMLEMNYEDMTVYWVYGAQESPAAGYDGES